MRGHRAGSLGGGCDAGWARRPSRIALAHARAAPTATPGDFLMQADLGLGELDRPAEWPGMEDQAAALERLAAWAEVDAVLLRSKGHMARKECGPLGRC